VHDAAGDHRRQKQQRGRNAGAGADERRSGTIAGEAPADTEDRSAEDQRQVDRARGRKQEFRGHDRSRAARDDVESDCGGQRGAAQDECERRVEVAEDIEESDHDGRVGHPRKREADPEQGTAKQRGKDGFHAAPPNR